MAAPDFVPSMGSSSQSRGARSWAGVIWRGPRCSIRTWPSSEWNCVASWSKQLWPLPKLVFGVRLHHKGFGACANMPAPKICALPYVLVRIKLCAPRAGASPEMRPLRDGRIHVALRVALAKNHMPNGVNGAGREAFSKIELCGNWVQSIRQIRIFMLRMKPSPRPTRGGLGGKVFMAGLRHCAGLSAFMRINLCGACPYAGCRNSCCAQKPHQNNPVWVLGLGYMGFTTFVLSVKPSSR